MAYIPTTRADLTEMLATIGVSDPLDLFSDVPEKVLLKEPIAIDAPRSEYETLRWAGELAAANHPAGSAYANFMGAGSYEHFIPSAVQAIAQRGEILTAYTPYQAEASQGTLQTIFEFQSMICTLTGMDVANASMYDGASALAEAALMAMRIKGRHEIVLPDTLHPNYRGVVESYTKALGATIHTWTSKDGLLDPSGWPAEATEPAGVVIQQPNFYGSLEDAEALAAFAKSKGAIVIGCVNPMSLSMITPPGEWGAEIAVGEGQPMGLPMNFGGPYAGFLSTKQEHIRKMPGRIIGRTQDHEGRDGFVLTLQTREQHIRREKATSNICTNQGLCATMVTLWISLIGKNGFDKLGRLNMDRAGRLFDAVTKLAGVKALNTAPFFNEFTVRLPIAAQTFYDRMRERGVLPGLPASRLGGDPNLLIVCATETKLDADLERYVTAAKASL